MIKGLFNTVRRLYKQCIDKKNGILITPNMDTITGDITVAAVNYDIVVQGCNCFCKQGAGLAKTFSKVYDTLNPDKYTSEHRLYEGDIMKLGNFEAYNHTDKLVVINAYTQYQPGANASLEAISMCFQKINNKYKGFSILIPQIGCGIGGLNWEEVKPLIIKHTPDMEVTFITYEPS